MKQKKKNISAKIFTKNGKLMVKLPLTNPTGKIRVKRKDEESNYGLPKATKSEAFTDYDYVEWQISYTTENPTDESKVDDINELKKLLCEGIKLGILSNDDICELKRFINSVQSTETLQENEKILRENISKEIKGEFRKFVEKVPVFIKENKEMDYFVEIILRHRQRAVGLQAMVYLCIYVRKLKDEKEGSLMGRPANPSECGLLEITSENKAIIIDVIKAFAIASQQHKDDIFNILNQVEKRCKP